MLILECDIGSGFVISIVPAQLVVSAEKYVVVVSEAEFWNRVSSAHQGQYWTNTEQMR